MADDQLGTAPVTGKERVTTYQVPAPQRADPYEAVLNLRDQIRTDMEDLFPELIAPLPPREMAYLAGLRRIHSPEQFVRELGWWMEVNGNADLLSPEQRIQLAQLERTCIRCQQMIASLPQ
jgi:hypothetical protein